MQHQINQVKEVIVRSTEGINEKSEWFPAKTWNLSDSPCKKEQFAPIYCLSLVEILWVFPYQKQPRSNDEWNDIPMILLLSNFSFVVQQMQFKI